MINNNKVGETNFSSVYVWLNSYCYNETTGMWMITKNNISSSLRINTVL